MSELQSWTPIDLVALGNVAPPEPTFSGLGYPGTITITYAEPEALKSWLEAIIAVEAIRRGETVLWLDFEMTAALVLGRLRNLGLTDNEISERFIYIRPSDPLRDAATRSYVEAMVAERKPSLVTVDAIAGMLDLHGLIGKEGGDVERLYGMLDEIFHVRDGGQTALRLIDHVAKDRESRGRWPIDSQRKLGAADTGLSVEVKQRFSPGGTGVAKVRIRKDRLGGIQSSTATLTLTSDPETRLITWTLDFLGHDDDTAGTEGDSFRPTILMERASEWVEKQTAPVSKSAIATHCKGSKQYLLQAVEALADEGYLTLHGSKYLHAKRFFSVPEPFPNRAESGSLVPGVTDTRTRNRSDEPDDPEVERLKLLYLEEVAP